MNERLQLHLATNKIDVITAVLGICGGLASLYFYTVKSANAYLLMIGLIFTFTSIAYLLFRDKLVSIYPVELKIQPNTHLNLVLHIIFVLLFTSSIYVLHTNIFRPPIYFILISLCSAILAVEVFLYNQLKKYQLYILLFEICLVAFNLRAGIYLNYGGMIGADPWVFRPGVVDIINTCVVESKFGQYSIFVIMHIYSAIASLICGVSSKLGMFIAVTLPNIICSILIFLIARKLFDEKIGLIAMLIYGFCDFSIAYSIQICAWSFGIALYIITLYLLFVDNKSIKKYRSYFLFVFFGLLILTHPVPTTIMSIPLIILFVYAKLFKSKIIVSGTLVIAYIVGMLSYWIYASYSRGNVEQNFFSYIVSPLYSSLTTQAAVLHRVETIESTTGSVGGHLLFGSLLNILGFSLLVLFGLLGGLILLSDKRRDILKLSLIPITFVLFAFPFAFGFFGIRNIMNYRWFVYGYVTLAILAAIGLHTIIRQCKSTNKKIITIFLIIFVLSFFMTTNTMCNHDSPIYFKNSATRLAFSGQELSLRNELINTYSGPITTDYIYHIALNNDVPYPDPGDIKFYSARYSYEDFCNGVLPQSLFIWREDYKDRPIELLSPSKGRMQVVFGENFEEKLESGAYNRIYCNEQVTAYLYIQQSTSMASLWGWKS